MIEANAFYSNALGGIKIQVEHEDYDKARAILIEKGNIRDGVVTKSEIEIQLHAATSKLSFLKKLPLEIRVLSILGILVVLSMLIYFLSVIPSITEVLTQNNWCVSKISFKENKQTPSTDLMILSFVKN